MNEQTNSMTQEEMQRTTEQFVAELQDLCHSYCTIDQAIIPSILTSGLSYLTHQVLQGAPTMDEGQQLVDSVVAWAQDVAKKDADRQLHDPEIDLSLAKGDPKA